MAIQIGTTDGLINITESNFKCFTSAIYNFSQNGGIEHAIKKGISLGNAFQRYVEPVYTGISKVFNIASIDTPVYTKGGKEQSPAKGTFCRKMGLLNVDDRTNIFQLTPIALELYKGNITIEEYAFILMTKQGIFKDGIYVQNLFVFIANWFDKHTIISESDLRTDICTEYSDSDIEKTRIDIILNALALCGLIANIGSGKYVLASITAADIFKDFISHQKIISKSLKDDDSSYTNYVGSIDYGIFDILSQENLSKYNRLYPNICKYIKTKKGITHQIIFYGAPGTGKSHKIKEQLAGVSKDNIFRTTFHPDSDYSTFVGAYKPTKSKKPLYGLNGGLTVRLNDGEDLSEDIITYKFIPQAFLNAYMRAYSTNDNVYLIIEEINRGNCAQIFGDLFQLLDRDEKGVSEYTIKADADLKDFLIEELGAGSDAIKDGELCIPSNLYIYATMNTSDQSLFPIDSAFKRRWDWEYEPIKYHNTDWIINIQDNSYSWVSFQQEINKRVFEANRSEDKMLGDYFVNPVDGIITEKILLNKILFYLWNDVCKDGEGDIFKTKDNKDLTFSDLHGDGGSEKLISMMEYLNIKTIGLDIETDTVTESTKTWYHDLWSEVASKLKGKGISKLPNASSRSYYPLSIGITGISIVASVSKTKRNGYIGYYIDKSQANTIYPKLLDLKDSIEKVLGTLEWQRDGDKYGIAKLNIDLKDINDDKMKDSYTDLISELLAEFRTTIIPLVDTLR